MSLIVINDPGHLPWQTNLFDLMMLTMFASAATYSVVQFASPAPGPGTGIESVTAAMIFIYLIGFSAMAVANVAFEKGITAYIAVQVAGLILLGGLTLFPAIRRRRTAITEPTAARKTVAA